MLKTRWTAIAAALAVAFIPAVTSAQSAAAAPAPPRLLQAAPGSGLTVSFLRDPDVDDAVAGIAGIEQLAWKDGRWTVEEEMNGDQSDQGRGLLLDAHTIHLYRVRLYSYPRR